MQETAATKPKPVTCWRYAIPNVHHQGWAIVHIDSSGFLGVVSDFGNYAHQWVSWGDKDFREFLLELGRTDKDYLHSKLGRRTCFDRAATAQAFREDILEGRRQNGYDQKTARQLWDAVAEFLDDDHSADWLLENTSAIVDGWEMLRYDYESLLRGFVQHVWPRIQAAIREDLTREAIPSGVS